MSPSSARGGSKALLGPTVCALLLGLLSCSEEGAVVFGATTEINPQLIERVDVTLEVAGEKLAPRSFAQGELAFPLEVRLDALEDGAEVKANFEVVSGGAVVLSRKASTNAVGGRELLYPLKFDAACTGPLAPKCPADQTCAAGACIDPQQDASKLADYYPGWAGTNGGDRCEPGGSPELFVGEGQASFLPLADGAVVQVEAGPQGGYHIWIAARARNVKQSGSVTEVSGSIAELGYTLTPFSVVFTLEGDEGGYCRIFGLRFRLDDSSHPIEGLLGKTLDLKVKISDPDGDVATGEKSVRLSDTVL